MRIDNLSQEQLDRIQGDLENRYAFRPSVMEEAAGIKVVFERSETYCWFNWRRFRFMNARNVTEVWIEPDGQTFEPGHSWIEWEELP